MPRSTIRHELRRADIAGGDTGGLPTSLVDAIEADGGLWYASDHYTDPADIVAKAREVGAVALRLDVRDLSLLELLPDIRYLYLRTDGRPRLDPIASLSRLRALFLGPKALTGTLDPLAFPDLRWLGFRLGGKGGEAMMRFMAAGHPGLEWLAISAPKARTAADVVAGFPRLRSVRIGAADSLRSFGSLAELAPDLRKIGLNLTDIRSLDGLEGLADLETIDLFGGSVTDLGQVRDLRRLRYARLVLSGVQSIEPLRGHPSLRMVHLKVAGDVDETILGSIPGLVAVGRSLGYDGETRWPNMLSIDDTDPLRVEWFRAMRD